MMDADDARLDLWRSLEIEGDPVEAFTGQPTERTIGWHLHRYTVWGTPTAVPSITGAFTGATTTYQERRCVKCDRVRRRKVLLEVDVP